jgi:hypothetical protein
MPRLASPRLDRCFLHPHQQPPRYSHQSHTNTPTPATQEYRRHLHGRLNGPSSRWIIVSNTAQPCATSCKLRRAASRDTVPKTCHGRNMQCTPRTHLKEQSYFASHHLLTILCQPASYHLSVATGGGGTGAAMSIPPCFIPSSPAMIGLSEGKGKRIPTHTPTIATSPACWSIF